MSHHCHDEHEGHDHGHGGHEHDHSDDITPALHFSLYQHVDFDKIVTLNEAEHGSGREIVRKTWADRLSPQPELESSCDEQLLMHVPFAGQVKLHSILLRSSDSSSAPQTLKLFVNRPEGAFDFSDAESQEPVQTLELPCSSDVLELPLKRAKFAQVTRLSLFFPDNWASEASDDGDEEVTRISYIGFKGEWMQVGRAPTNILYEAAANPSDHAVKGTNVNQMGSGIGGRGPGV